MRHFMIGIAAAVALAPTVASAQLSGYSNPYGQQQQPRSGSSYDWQTGNSYRYRTDSQGNTTVNGYNYQTGSSWQSRTDARGNQRGTDANGNSWNYNARTGTYYNYGTGQTCYGRGDARTCY